MWSVLGIQAALRVTSSLPGPVVPSFPALSERLKCTVRRHNLNQEYLVLGIQAEEREIPERFTAGSPPCTRSLFHPPSLSHPPTLSFLHTLTPLALSFSHTHSRGGRRACCTTTSHQQPEVNYSPCFENDHLPCRLHVFHVVCRVNHYSRNKVDSSLQVVGGRGGAAPQPLRFHLTQCINQMDSLKSIHPQTRQLNSY